MRKRILSILLCANSIMSKPGYYFNSSSGAVSLTATDGDISLTAKDSYNGAARGQSVSLTASSGQHRDALYCFHPAYL